MNSTPTSKPNANALWGKIIGWGAFLLFLVVGKLVTAALPKDYSIYKVAALEPLVFGLAPLILIGLVSILLKRASITAIIVGLIVLLAALNLISACCAYAAAMSGGTFPSKILDHFWFTRGPGADPRDINLLSYVAMILHFGLFALVLPVGPYVLSLWTFNQYLTKQETARQSPSNNGE